MALTLFRSSLHKEVSLLVLLRLQILWYLLLPFVGILLEGHVLNPLLLYHKYDAGGELG